MKKYYAIIALLLIGQIAVADIGFVYKGDLNGDGIEDALMSGPYMMFGNGGGPFMLRLGQKDGSYIDKVIGLHPKAVALERNGVKSRLWSYWHMSAIYVAER